MSIKYVIDSVFDAECEAIVNTINCRGVMGAGIALEFSLRFPNMYEWYKRNCANGAIQTGKTYLYEENGKKIILFPTKDDPKEKSQRQWIEEGLAFFALNYKSYNVKSVAFPPLGCANGKLDFENDVKPLMEEYLSGLDIDIKICLNADYLSNHNQRMLCCLNDLSYHVLKEIGLGDEATINIMIARNKLIYFEDLAADRIIKGHDYRKLYDYCSKKLGDIIVKNNNKSTVIIGESPYLKTKDRIVATGIIKNFGFNEVAFLSNNNKIAQTLIFSILFGSLDKGARFIKNMINKYAMKYVENILENQAVYFINRKKNLKNIQNFIDFLLKDSSKKVQCLIVGTKSIKQIETFLTSKKIEFEEVAHPSPHNFVHEVQIIDSYFPLKSQLRNFHVL